MTRQPRRHLVSFACSAWGCRCARGQRGPRARQASGIAETRLRAARDRAGHRAQRPTHDHPGYDGGEHRPAAYPGQLALLRDQPVLGAERIHADIRRPAAARGPGRRHSRPAADVRRRHQPVYPRLAGRGARGHCGPAAGRPGPAGRGRGFRLARRPGAHRDQLPRGPGEDPRARHLHWRDHRRFLARPGTGRGDYRVAVLALGAVHQRTDRPGRGGDRTAVRRRDAAAAWPLRPGRRADRHRRGDRAGVRVHPGRGQRLG